MEKKNWVSPELVLISVNSGKYSTVTVEGPMYTS